MMVHKSVQLIIQVCTMHKCSDSPKFLPILEDPRAGAGPGDQGLGPKFARVRPERKKREPHRTREQKKDRARKRKKKERRKKKGREEERKRLREKGRKRDNKRKKERQKVIFNNTTVSSTCT